MADTRIVSSAPFGRGVPVPNFLDRLRVKFTLNRLDRAEKLSGSIGEGPAAVFCSVERLAGSVPAEAG